jgi:colicin import membrane protein
MASVKPFLSSIMLHVLALGLLLVSLNLTPTPQQPARSDADIIDAVTVDSKQVEQELSKIRDLEQEQQQQQARKQQELEQQTSELQKQSEEAERKRLAEEKRLADLKKQQQQEEQRRKEEELKLAEARKEQEELQKQQEEERKQKEGAERKRQEELRLAEEEKKRKEAEEALKQKLAEEQRQLKEAQDRQDLNVINGYVGRIADAIEREFNTAGLPPGLSCVLQIRMIPGGEVAEARIDKTSGSSVFDSRAEIAVKRASPLPVPENPRIFDKMRVIRLTFAPN